MGFDAACKSYSLEGRHFVNACPASAVAHARLPAAHCRHSHAEVHRQCEAEMSGKSVPPMGYYSMQTKLLTLLLVVQLS